MKFRHHSTALGDTPWLRKKRDFPFFAEKQYYNLVIKDRAAVEARGMLTLSGFLIIAVLCPCCFVIGSLMITWSSPPIAWWQASFPDVIYVCQCYQRFIFIKILKKISQNLKMAYSILLFCVINTGTDHKNVKLVWQVCFAVCHKAKKIFWSKFQWGYLSS